MSAGIETVMHENRRFAPPADFVAKANLRGFEAYEALCSDARRDPEAFWGKLARESLQWQRPFTQVLDASRAPFYRWFADGLLNVSANCLDRHLGTAVAKRDAIVFEADDGRIERISYQDLHARVCRVANGLAALGLRAGDRVAIYLPMAIETVIAMQACARLGLVHTVVFAGFSAKALQDRIADTGAAAVICADQQLRGGRTLPSKDAVDEALALGGCTTVRHVLVHRRTGRKVGWVSGRDHWLHEIEAAFPPQCAPAELSAEHPLFVLYTSGSTGKPKGVQHTCAGYLMQALLSLRWSFDLKADDIFWCTADLGWVTGHSYVAYGPLAAGVTQLLYEGVPTHPHAGRLFQMVERHRVSILYTAPTVIRSLVKATEAQPQHKPERYDLGSLRLLGSVGEPINPEAWVWYHASVGGGRCPVIDTWWQTETGAHMIAPLPGVHVLEPGSCGMPLPGVQATVVDEHGHELPAGQGGLLVIRGPWPAMMRTVWGDHERYRKAYWPEALGGDLYLTGDGASRDEHGNFRIIGRIDDVLNVSGHRLGSIEIESALVAHTKVAEAAVVSRPDATTGEAISAFVVLKGERPEGAAARLLADELRAWVAQEIGAIAKPREVRFGDSLPKTRSGKIMRRLLRSLARGDEIVQDLSTLENPAVIAQLDAIA